MTRESLPQNTQEVERAPDDARKFIVHEVDRTLLEADEVVRCYFPTDWLETDEDSEKKIVRKTFDDGSIQMLLIAKTTEDGKRHSEKRKLSQEEYDTLKEHTVLSVEKTRYSFVFLQDGTQFQVNYDEFADSDLKILEVDAKPEELRALFRTELFPGTLEEVAASDRSYEGYRVASHL